MPANKTRRTSDKNAHSLYHFTTYDALKDIYEKQRFRLSLCSSAKNADVETEALERAIKRILNGYNCKKIKDNFPGKADDEIVNELIKFRRSTYIACFCDLKSDAELSLEGANYMWNNYAKGAQGLVIKFKKGSFPITTGSTFINDKRVPEARMGEVLYRFTELEKRLCHKIKEAHIFYTDIYKPSCCQRENEKRLMVYANTQVEEQLPESFEAAPGKDEYIYYVFDKPNTSCVIEGIFCKNHETEERIRKLVGQSVKVNLLQV